MNAYKLPNAVLGLGLTPNELYVYAYLCSIHTRTATLLGDLVKVKQSTIAGKCRLQTTETVSRIVSALMQKGLIQRVIRGVKADGRRGTNSYIISKTATTGGYFYLERRVFGAVSARQLRVYLFIAKSYSRSLCDSWNSYNDIAAQLCISRSEAIETITQLVALKLITKERRKSAANRRVFVDNHYRLIFTAAHRRIRRKIKTRKKPRSYREHSFSRIISTLKKMLQVHCSNLFAICQAFFYAFFGRGSPSCEGGSPTNQGSYIRPKVSNRKRKSLGSLRFLYLKDAGYF